MTCTIGALYDVMAPITVTSAPTVVVSRMFT